MANNIDFSVYRLKIQPGGAEDGVEPYEFCKQEGVVGVGWGYNNVPFVGDDGLGRIETIPNAEVATDRHNAIETKYVEQKGDDYTPSRVKQNGELKASLRYMISEMDEGDLAWVNEGSEFAVCRITGDWQTDLDLDADDQAPYARNDIRNFREAEWTVIPYTMVPGFVKRRFAGQGSTLSKMHITDRQCSISEQIFSAREFDETMDGIVDSVAASLNNDVDTSEFFGVLDPVEIEDLVILKLQDGTDGWSIIKSTTSSSEADIECELRRVTDGQVQRGFVQVKSGNATVSPENYEDKAEHGNVFLFAQTPVAVSQWENMNVITPRAVLDFVKENPGYLPDTVLVKLNTYL